MPKPDKPQFDVEKVRGHFRKASVREKDGGFHVEQTARGCRITCFVPQSEADKRGDALFAQLARSVERLAAEIEAGA